MKRLMKFLSVTILSIIMAVVGSVPISAEEVEIVPFAQRCVPNRSVEVIGKGYTTEWGTPIRNTNSTGTEQSMSYSVTRTKSSSFGVSGTYEIDMLV